MTFSINTTGWTQEKINMIHAMTVKILFDNGVTYTGMYFNGSDITIDNPSSDPTQYVTSASVSSAYDTWKTASDLAKTEYDAAQQIINGEITANAMTTYTFTQIDNAIDAILNLSDAKIFLKKLARYVKARIG